MPELPEITVLARQMRTQLVGKTITRVIETIKTGSTSNCICPACQPREFDQ
jgi:formamidopyrimidine-DNA glycosylase